MAGVGAPGQKVRVKTAETPTALESGTLVSSRQCSGHLVLSVLLLRHGQKTD